MAPPDLAAALPYLAHASLSQLMPLSHAHALSLQQGRHHTCGLFLGLVFIVQGWSGGALPRWRPPLTLSSSALGLVFQWCAGPVRSGFLVLGFWVLLSLYK